MRQHGSAPNTGTRGMAGGGSEPLDEDMSVEAVARVELLKRAEKLAPGLGADA